MSEQWTRDITKVRELLSTSIKSLFLWAFPGYLTFAFLPKILIEVIYSPQYVEAAQLFPVYLLGIFLLGISMMLMIALYTGGHPKRRAATMLLGAIFNVAIAIMLIPVYGAMGAAIAFLIAQAFIVILSLFFVSRKVGLKFDKRNLLWLVPIIVFTGILYMATFYDDIFIITAILIIANSIYFVLLTKLKILNKNDTMIFESILEKLNLKLFKNKR
jgi:O-antigen/teichoic acid export membrane protein